MCNQQLTVLNTQYFSLQTYSVAHINQIEILRNLFHAAYNPGHAHCTYTHKQTLHQPEIGYAYEPIYRADNPPTLQAPLHSPTNTHAHRTHMLYSINMYLFSCLRKRRMWWDVVCDVWQRHLCPPLATTMQCTKNAFANFSLISLVRATSQLSVKWRWSHYLLCTQILINLIHLNGIIWESTATPCIIYTIFCPSPHVYIADMTADVPRNVRRELVRFRNVSINFAKLYLCSITTAAA